MIYLAFLFLLYEIIVFMMPNQIVKAHKHFSSKTPINWSILEKLLCLFDTFYLFWSFYCLFVGWEITGAGLLILVIIKIFRNGLTVIDVIVDCLASITLITFGIVKSLM